MTSNAGCRQILVQPTALSRRREGIPKGRQYAPAGRPPKRLPEQSDCHIQTNRDQQDHVKCKQSLILNERKTNPTISNMEVGTKFILHFNFNREYHQTFSGRFFLCKVNLYYLLYSSTMFQKF